MALIKRLYPGNRIIFDLSSMEIDLSKEISVIVAEKRGKEVELKIYAHRSVPVTKLEGRYESETSRIPQELKFQSEI